jgi:hypothetical protein
MKTLSRAGAVLVAVCAVVGLTNAPAQAGAFGLVINDLHSSYTVKVAEFGVGGESCPAWNGNGPGNGVTYTCRTRWLPSGRRSDSGDFSFWYDADGVMIQSDYEVYLESTGTFHWVPAFTWTRIHNNGTAHCYETLGTWSYYHAQCYIAS